MYAAIFDLGYSPGIAEKPPTVSPDNKSASVPEPVFSALALAKSNDSFVFIDFYAEWCAACKVLKSRTLESPQVLSALERYVVLNVDTDLYEEAAAFYNVVGMPTLLILNAAGEEVYRSVGLVEADDLALKLQRLVVK
ncbi:MAG: thioredoxin domain-containing protein [Proteobacteria bacterium]|nr:thioredoxin domain-containing protein [Pseudomonadota bacterium]